MCDMVLEITHPPFGHERAFAALYVGKVFALRGLTLTIVLRGDGVFTGLRGQKDSMGSVNLPPTEAQLEEILGLDVRVVAEKEALEYRGIGVGDLIEGIEVLATEDIHDIVVNTEAKVVPF